MPCQNAREREILGQVDFLQYPVRLSNPSRSGGVRRPARNRRCSGVGRHCLPGTPGSVLNGTNANAMHAAWLLGDWSVASADAAEADAPTANAVTTKAPLTKRAPPMPTSIFDVYLLEASLRPRRLGVCESCHSAENSVDIGAASVESRSFGFIKLSGVAWGFALERHLMLGNVKLGPCFVERGGTRAMVFSRQEGSSLIGAVRSRVAQALLGLTVMGAVLLGGASPAWAGLRLGVDPVISGPLTVGQTNGSGSLSIMGLQPLM